MAAPTLHQSKVTSKDTLADEPMYLTVMGPSVFETYPLPASGKVDIGREDDADVRIVDELASRTHARLHIEPSGKLSVEDLESSNGTFVRGERIDAGKRVALQLGEALTIGFTHLMVQRRRPRPSVRRLRSHAAFEERLEEACERAGERPGAGPALIRVRFQDEAPSGRGADLIQAGLRSGDLLAQYAAGDYEVLVLDTEPARVQEIADDIARRARGAQLAAQTVIVAYPTHGRTAEALIGQASALLLDPEGETDTAPVLKSDAMRALYRLAERASAGHTAAGLITVLVLGETGTGKEVLANWIHSRSPRAAGPFVCINCAALTETLLESELFGHEKGAFTGAAAAKPGLLESASGGTVFLDEIGEMNAALQTKLLRALESREIMRVGGRVTRPIDVRFIAATNRDLEAAIAGSSFRQDLYFRLNGISLTIPPLRERTTDVAPLARRFIAQASRAAKCRPPRLSPEAVELLEGYSWPGNIRELRNVMERALVLCDGGEITVEHLPVEKLRLQRISLAAPNGVPAAPPAVTAGDSGDGDADRERRRILDAMAELGGNQTRVAAKLGMARGTLIARLERYGIKRPQAARKRAAR
jgi:two-component system, NtrC family, response regulator AtoC